MSRISLIAFLFLGLVNLGAKDWKNELFEILELHCYDCHGDGAKKGGLAMDELSVELENPEVFVKWERIYDRALNSEMPLKKIKDRPQPNELEELRLHLKPALALAHKKAKVIDLTASKSVQLNLGQFH